MLRVPSDISSQEFESLKIQDMTFVAYRNEVYPSRYEVFFEEHAVIVVLEGEKKFSSTTQEVRVEKGDILFVQRGFYLMSESIHEAYKSLVFFFDEKLLKEFVGLHGELFEGRSEPGRYPPANADSALAFVRKLLAVCQFGIALLSFPNQPENPLSPAQISGITAAPAGNR